MGGDDGMDPGGEEGEEGRVRAGLAAVQHDEGGEPAASVVAAAASSSRRHALRLVLQLLPPPARTPAANDCCTWSAPFAAAPGLRPRQVAVPESAEADPRLVTWAVRRGPTLHVFLAEAEDRADQPDEHVLGRPAPADSQLHISAWQQLSPAMVPSRSLLLLLSVDALRVSLWDDPQCSLRGPPARGADAECPAAAEVALLSLDGLRAAVLRSAAGLGMRPVRPPAADVASSAESMAGLPPLGVTDVAAEVDVLQVPITFFSDGSLIFLFFCV